jgi:hypothetical protein
LGDSEDKDGKNEPINDPFAFDDYDNAMGDGADFFTAEDNPEYRSDITTKQFKFKDAKKRIATYHARNQMRELGYAQHKLIFF